MLCIACSRVVLVGEEREKHSPSQLYVGAPTSPAIQLALRALHWLRLVAFFGFTGWVFSCRKQDWKTHTGQLWLLWIYLISSLTSGKKYHESTSASFLVSRFPIKPAKIFHFWQTKVLLDFIRSSFFICLFSLYSNGTLIFSNLLVSIGKPKGKKVTKDIWNFFVSLFCVSLQSWCIALPQIYTQHWKVQALCRGWS